MKKFISYFNGVQWSILFSMLFATLITGGFADPIGAICSFTGVMCVLLVAKGAISNYYWGAVNVALYAYLAFNARLYGDFMLNTFYYLPLNIAGIWIWKKHMSEDGDLQARIMTFKQRVVLGFGSVFAVLLYTLVLKQLGGNIPLIDATSTVFSVIAMILMLKVYAEQWVLWIVVNVVSVIMWIFPLIDGEQGAIAMVIMWSAYLANAVYGYILWKRMAK